MIAASKYTYKLRAGSGSLVDITPVWAGASITDALENGQQFHRKKFDGSFTLYRDDFNLVNGADFDTEFNVFIYKQIDGTPTYQAPTLRFYKTDCRFKPSEKKCEVRNFESYDLYDTILDALDKEHNLLDAEPPTTPVTLRKQAILQIAFPGADFVANFTDGMFWEQPVTTPIVIAPQDHEDMADYGFAFRETTEEWIFGYIPGNDTLSPDVSGLYRCYAYGANGNWSSQGANFKHVTKDFWITYFDTGGGPGTARAMIRNAATGDPGDVLYLGPIGGNTVNTPYHTGNGAVMTSETDPTSTCEFFAFRPYARLLTNKTEVSGDSTTALDDTDPFPHGSFTHALPVYVSNWIFSDESTTTPTRWGKFSDDEIFHAGEYFTRPDSPNGNPVYPLINSQWTGVSMWFYYDTALRELQEEAGETVTVQDCYKVSDAIQAMLRINDIPSFIAHGDGTQYSDFFYSEGTNTIRGTRKVPVIVPISNVLYDYDQPAQKALLRISELFNLLEKFHKAHWFLGPELQLKLEHWQYFDNGHSYSGDEIGTDLTLLSDYRTGYPVEFGQGVIEYAKQELPERIEPGWMFEVSQPFKGYAIDILSGFVERGNVINEKINRFVSDLDFLNVYPGGVSLEGFVFLECVEDEDENLSVPFVEFTVSDEEEYRMNNGYASFLWAHDNYHRHGLPAPSVVLNKSTIAATSTIRPGVQEITVPEIGDIDPTKLVKTSFGNGRVESAKRDLEGKGYELKLRHRNE